MCKEPEIWDKDLKKKYFMIKLEKSLICHVKYATIKSSYPKILKFSRYFVPFYIKYEHFKILKSFLVLKIEGFRRKIYRRNIIEGNRFYQTNILKMKLSFPLQT